MKLGQTRWLQVPCILPIALFWTLGESVSLRVAKASQPSAPQTGFEKRRFVLVTGSEGSGTTLIAQILSEDDTSMGIPTNWQIKELSESAQSKYRQTQQFDDFNNLTSTLWKDTNVRNYILNDTDYRPTKWRDVVVGQLADSASSILRANSMHHLVYHRSMPFGDRRHTPFLEDMSLLREKMGLESQHVVIVIRHVPATWCSHGRADDSEPFLKRIEQLMSGDVMYTDMHITFVSYEKLLCNPQGVLEQVCGEAGLQCKNVLASPQIKAIPNHMQKHGSDPEYDQQLAEYEHKWNKMKHKFPLIDKFVSDGKKYAEQVCRTELQQEDAASERLGASQPGASDPEGPAQQEPRLNGPSRLETVIARIRASLAENNMDA